MLFHAGLICLFACNKGRGCEAFTPDDRCSGNTMSCDQQKNMEILCH